MFIQFISIRHQNFYSILVINQVQKYKHAWRIFFTIWLYEVKLFDNEFLICSLYEINGLIFPHPSFLAKIIILNLHRSKLCMFVGLDFQHLSISLPADHRTVMLLWRCTHWIGSCVTVNQGVCLSPHKGVMIQAS